MDLQRVRYTGGRLSGADLELPAHLADEHPDRFSISPGGVVWDRQEQRAVRAAVVHATPSQ